VVPARREDVVGEIAGLTIHVLFSIMAENHIERTDMSLLQASNFKVTIKPERPAVSVLFRPTGRRYTYTAIANRTERSRHASLAPGFCVDRDGADLGRYDDSAIQRRARKLALATAEKIFRAT
jgi:hypothetical protein